MFKSIKSSNGSYLQVGNVQVQPAVEHVSATNTSNASVDSKQSLGSLAAAETPLTNASVVAKGSIARAPTLNDAISAVTKGHAVSAINSTMSSIMPVAHVAVESKLGFDEDDLAKAIKRFEPYEQLTGISHERPEIIALTNFEPLYLPAAAPSRSRVNVNDHDELHTIGGKYFEFQTDMRALQRHKMVQSVKDARKMNRSIDLEISQRVRAFNGTMQDVQEAATFLFSVIRGLEKLKAQMDLRAKTYSINAASVAREYEMTYSTKATQSKFSPSAVKEHIEKDFEIADVLQKIGFTAHNIKNRFSSTKVWLQLLVELKNTLLAHSVQFIDVVPAQYKNDDNGSAIIRLSDKRFNLNPQLSDIPDVNNLINSTPDQAQDLLNRLSRGFTSMYQDVSFKTQESRIAALAHLVSREFRYSNGLASIDVQMTLSRYYKTSVNVNGNTHIFDAIVGNPGNDIGDVPTTRGSSLVDVAQHSPGSNIGVLTFEEKYIDGDNGSLTPGGTYYVDQTLRTDGTKFDVSRLQELSNVLDVAYKSLGTMTSGMNLLMLENRDPNTLSVFGYEYKLSNPLALFDDIAKSFVDYSTGNVTTDVRNDVLSGLFVLASQPTATWLKAMLFTYVMCKTTRHYDTSDANSPTTASASDNTPMTDFLAKMIVMMLQSIVPSSTTAGQQYSNMQVSAADTFFSGYSIGNTSIISYDALLTLIKQGSPLLERVVRYMKKIMVAFRNNFEAFINGKSRYSACIDSVVMMAAFDLIVNTIARYSGKVFTGRFESENDTIVFIAANTTTNFKSSITEVRTRLGREIGLTQQMMYSILETLKRLRDAATGMVNYLQSPSSISMLQNIAKTIGDSDLLQLLMSEQQIALLMSTATDVNDRANYTPKRNVIATQDDDDDVDLDDEVRFLDNGVLSTRYKNALKGFFRSSEFAQSRAHNKKIVTIGVPLGFTRRLKQRIDIRDKKLTSFDDRQSDIVAVSVYRVDIQNSDVVYKPQKFLFELSRFPVRNENLYPTINANNVTIDASFFGKFPTRDFAQRFENRGGDTVQYGAPGKDQTEALSGESYEFLARDQKDEIIRNHVVSMFIESYLRVMTGMDLSDHRFDFNEEPSFIEPTFASSLISNHISDIVKTSKLAEPIDGRSAETRPRGVFFSIDSSIRRLDASADAEEVFHIDDDRVDANSITSVARSAVVASTTAANVSRADLPLAIQHVATVSAASRVPSTFSNDMSIAQWLIRPKKFDRVLHVIVDPDEFEVDYEKTVSTPHGKVALDQLVARGDVVLSDENATLRTRTPNSIAGNAGAAFFVRHRPVLGNALYKYRSRDKSSGDTTFDKYFVTIETFGEEVV